MNTRRTTLLIAVLLAIGTGWLTLNYVSGIQRSNEAAGVPRQVLIATQDIPARVTVTPAMLRTDMRPSTALQPDALTDPSRAVGSLALVTIPAGSQVTASQISAHADSALPVRLQSGMRAVSIQIDKVKGVSGLVQPGDRVDVIAIPPRNNNGLPKAETILRGLRVLAIGTALEYPSATPSPDEQQSTTVTLEVNPKQADLLAWADVDATLRLALRSPKEPIRSAPAEELTLLDFGNSGSAPAAPMQAMAAPNAAPAAAPAAAGAPAAKPTAAQASHWSGGVQVIEGDQMVGPGAAPQNSSASEDPNQ
jgi:pilus assembly protein CpaB